MSSILEALKKLEDEKARAREVAETEIDAETARLELLGGDAKRSREATIRLKPMTFALGAFAAAVVLVGLSAGISLALARSKALTAEAGKWTAAPAVADYGASAQADANDAAPRPSRQRQESTDAAPSAYEDVSDSQGTMHAQNDATPSSIPGAETSAAYRERASLAGQTPVQAAQPEPRPAGPPAVGTSLIREEPIGQNTRLEPAPIPPAAVTTPLVREEPVVENRQRGPAAPRPTAAAVPVHEDPVTQNARAAPEPAAFTSVSKASLPIEAIADTQSKAVDTTLPTTTQDETPEFTPPIPPERPNAIEHTETLQVASLAASPSPRGSQKTPHNQPSTALQETAPETDQPADRIPAEPVKAAVPAPAEPARAEARERITQWRALRPRAEEKPASRPLPKTLSSLPPLTDSVRTRYGLTNMRLNMPRPANDNHPHASAIINMKPVWQGETILGTDAKLIGVERGGIAIEIIPTGDRYYLRF